MIIIIPAVIARDGLRFGLLIERIKNPEATLIDDIDDNLFRSRSARPPALAPSDFSELAASLECVVANDSSVSIVRSFPSRPSIQTTIVASFPE